jgi:hypothetical protein
MRERRERLFARTNPRVRLFDFKRDAWVLWAAYDLASFPKLKADPQKEGIFKTPEDFFSHFSAHARQKSSVLLVEEDHKFFRERRGPVAMVSVEHNGWKVSLQFDFFQWATRRHRLAAAVSMLNMMRYDKEFGACVLEVGESDEAFCQHVRDRYGLLRFVGKVDNARADGDELIWAVPMKHARAVALKEAA